MKQTIFVLTILLSTVLSQFCQANPTGGTVTSGSATIIPNASTLNVNQTTTKVIINWNTFSIASGELTKFMQPSASAIALNRVTGTSPSAILGSLQANGQVFLLNQNGILFGNGSQVNVGGLVASTLTMSDANFLAGSYKLAQNTAAPLNSVVLQGSVNAKSIAAIAPFVYNDGAVLQASSASLVAGTTASVSPAYVVSLTSQVPPAGNTVIVPGAANDAALNNLVSSGIVSGTTLTANGDGTYTLKNGDGIAFDNGNISRFGTAAATISYNSLAATVLGPNSNLIANASGVNAAGGKLNLNSFGTTAFYSGSNAEAVASGTGAAGAINVSAANIYELGGTNAVLDGNSATLNATTGSIGNTGTLIGNVGKLSATAKSYIFYQNTTSLTLSKVTATNMGVITAQTGDLTVAGPVTASTIRLNSPNGSIYELGTSLVTGTQFAFLVAGNNIGTSTAPMRTKSPTLVLSAGGNINASNSIVGDLHVTVSNGTANVAFGGDTLSFSGGELNISTVNNSNVYFSNKTGSVDLDNIQMLQDLSVTASGNITNNLGNVAVANNLTLNAGGYVGTLAAPIGYFLSGGLDITAGGELNNVAISITGVYTSTLQYSVPAPTTQYQVWSDGACLANCP